MGGSERRLLCDFGHKKLEKKATRKKVEKRGCQKGTKEGPKEAIQFLIAAPGRPPFQEG